MMVKLKDLILERFELPLGLEKQLEDHTYSALGHILLPHFESFRYKLFRNKELNEKTYKNAKKLYDTILGMIGGKIKDEKIVFDKFFVNEYYSVSTASDITEQIKVVIEKSYDYINITSVMDSLNLGPHFVVDLNPDVPNNEKLFNEWWIRNKDSYDTMLNEFDNAIISNTEIITTLKKWKEKAKPINDTTFSVNDMDVKLAYRGGWEVYSYNHFFRVVKKFKEETYGSPNHYSKNDDVPYILQTIYVEQFPVDELSSEYFYEQTKNILNTTKHEGRHLFQYIGQKSRDIPYDYYGGPKSSIGHKSNKVLRGTDPSGKASPESKYTDLGDKHGRVLHPFRDVEYKTNLYNYKEDIEKLLSQNYPKNEWKSAFNKLILHTIGRLNYSLFSQQFGNGGWEWEIGNSKKNLKLLYDNDYPKFKQIIKELYSLIFK